MTTHLGIQLRAIVCRATFLSERLQHIRLENTPVSQGAAGWELLERWRSAVGPKGADWLEKRLRWDGLDPALTDLILEETPLETDLLPEWAIVLRNVSTAARSFDPAVLEGLPLDPTRPVPFENLLLPALVVAREMLCSRLSLQLTQMHFPMFGVISADAYRSLERSLLRELSAISGQTLESELRRSQPYGQSLLLMLDLTDETENDDTQYRAFVRTHLDSGLLTLMGSYPVLGRLIATAIEFWVEATAELLGRLVADFPAVADRFRLSGTPLQVSRFDLNLSDRHRRGRTVVLVEFVSGEKVVYKPKVISLESTFNELLEWCNGRGISPRLRVAAILDRGEYGWAEYLEQLPCADGYEAECFYLRAGMLLCLLYVLRATDCHYENLIAHGAHPVLIDAETLLYHEPQALDDSSPFEVGELLAERLLGDSVLRTGLLPRWEADGDQTTAQDISALGCADDQPASRTGLHWKRINTDYMHTRYETGILQAGHNVARLGEKALSALAYEAQLVAGFERMYRLILLHRDALVAADGPLTVMRDQAVRFVYRPTRVYKILTALSWNPEVLKSGIDYGIHLEQLARAFLAVPNKPLAWPVLAAEIQAMEQMDVPLFSACASGTALNIPGGTTVPDAFRKSSYAATIEFIGELCEADLQWQLAIVRAALHTSAAQTPEAVKGGPISTAIAPLLDRRALIREATAIGIQIEQRALADGKNGVNWIGLSYIEQADRFQLNVLNDSLYNGCGGVAVFLAALSAISGEKRFGTLALRSLEVLRQRVLSTHPQLTSTAARLGGLGGAVGLGSIIYSLVRTAVFLDEDDGLVEAASGVASWLTPEVISSDEKLDVMSGVAGTLLGLLSLYSVSGAPTVLEQAIACGNHLLLHRTLSAGGQRAWKTVAGTRLTGFSHGAAGISYALVRLYRVTHKRAYLDAAIDGIEFERSVFSEQHANWPDLRNTGRQATPSFPVKWCHGAAGIALARLGCRKIVDIAGIDSEIDIALRTTRDFCLQDTDYLCCGNFGRAETFLVAAGVTSQYEWGRLADESAADAVARATLNGGYRLFAEPGLYNPTFFQGTAGIGYQLLRLACNELPSVLLWE